MQDGATATATSDLARAGLVVGGKFRLDACIGQGGMGSVWSATHLGLGNQIAIKFVSRDLVRSPEALRRFDAEAKAVARLQSRHVVQVHDNGTLDDGTPYIAMELLTGESLQQRLDRGGPIPLDESVHLLSQCCKALGRAHSLGIVHRDIKPDNIYLARTPDDDGYVVKILDFGVAKITSPGESDHSSTKTGAVLGTPLYMSPEQARGLKNIDHRSDIYSLGLVAYTMWTGRVAFSGESFGDILIKICTEPLPSLRGLAQLPPGVDAWFQRVCARDPTLRCSSAQEFIETLRAATGVHAGSMGGSGVSAAKSSPGVAPTLADSDAPWKVPPAETQSIAETNVAITAAGVPRKNIGVAVAAGLLVTLLLVAGAAFLAMSSRARRDLGEGEASQPPPPATSVVPGPTIQPPATLAPKPPEPKLAPEPKPAAEPRASPVMPSPSPRPQTTPTATAPRTPPAPPTHVGPAASPAPAPSKPSATVDLGY